MAVTGSRLVPPTTGVAARAVPPHPLTGHGPESGRSPAGLGIEHSLLNPDADEAEQPAMPFDASAVPRELGESVIASTSFTYSGPLDTVGTDWPPRPPSDGAVPDPDGDTENEPEAIDEQTAELPILPVLESLDVNDESLDAVPGSGDADVPDPIDDLIDTGEVDFPVVPTVIEPVEPVRPAPPIPIPAPDSQPADKLTAAIRSGELQVIKSLISQGMLSTHGPITDRDVRTMVYVAFTSNELRKLILAGGTPDGIRAGDLDLGTVELFDESRYAPRTQTPVPRSAAGSGRRS